MSAQNGVVEAFLREGKVVGMKELPVGARTVAKSPKGTRVARG